MAAPNNFFLYNSNAEQNLVYRTFARKFREIHSSLLKELNEIFISQFDFKCSVVRQQLTRGIGRSVQIMMSAVSRALYIFE